MQSTNEETVFGAGFCIRGSQVGANALAAAFYPTGNRATGVSWTSAVGRSGSVLSSMVGGVCALGWYRRRRAIQPFGVIHTA